MPRPSGRLSQIIPKDWSVGRNRHAATLMLTSRCSISRPGTGAAAFDPVTGITSTPAPTTVHSNLACRVEVVPRTAGLLRTTAEERVDSRRYVVQVPWSVTGLSVRDVVTVTSSEDPALVGVELAVTSIQVTSLQWSRVLQCEVFQR